MMNVYRYHVHVVQSAAMFARYDDLEIGAFVLVKFLEARASETVARRNYAYLVCVYGGPANRWLGGMGGRRLSS